MLTLHFATLSVQCSASLQFSCRVSVFVFPPPPGLRTLLLHPGRRAQRQGVKNENEKNETNECHKTEHEGQKDDDSQGEHAQEHEHEEAACFQRRGRNANGAGQRERRWGRQAEKKRKRKKPRPFRSSFPLKSFLEGRLGGAPTATGGKPNPLFSEQHPFAFGGMGGRAIQRHPQVSGQP